MSNESKNRRFFIIHFTGTDENNKRVKGKIHMFTDEGKFPNEPFLHETIIGDFHLDHPYIGMIQELSESDFTDFTQGLEEEEDLQEKDKNKPDSSEFL